MKYSQLTVQYNEVIVKCSEIHCSVSHCTIHWIAMLVPFFYSTVQYSSMDRVLVQWRALMITVAGCSEVAVQRTGMWNSAVQWYVMQFRVLPRAVICAPYSAAKCGTGAQQWSAVQRRRVLFSEVHCSPVQWSRVKSSEVVWRKV